MSATIADMEPTQRHLTAIHESGHAVASVMRGGSSFRSLDLSRADDGHGLTLHRSKPADVPFIAYAGPWAEARYQWPADVARDGEDDDGLTFDDYVTGVLLGQPDDTAALAPHEQQVQQLRAAGVDVDPFAVWHMELERVWPAVQRIAARLLAGELIDDADVRHAVEAADGAH